MKFVFQYSNPILVTLYLTIPLLFVYLLSRFTAATFHSRKPLPPGPFCWPIIGNILIKGQLTHRGLANLAKQYGGLLHLRMGSINMMAISSPDIARQVLQVQDSICANRSTNAAIDYLTYNRADMVFAHYGPFWKQMRKLSVMKLFSRKRAESWDSVRDEVDSMVRLTATCAGRTVNVGELVFGLTHDIIFRAAFGSMVSDDKKEFIGILLEVSKLLGAFNIVDYIPWLGWIDSAGLSKRLSRAQASLDGFVDRIIDEHLEKNKGIRDVDEQRDTDMVDELLAFNGEEGENLQNSIKLTRDNIKAIVLDIMFGGTETLASAIEWVISELMHNPADLKRVQQELADVVGMDRRVEESDFKKLTYLKCCLKETLRLHPPIPLLLHENAEAIEVSGYGIPAKSRMIINVWAIGRDATYWKDANVFKPSRFLEKGALEFNGTNFEFIPFGSGRRSCPGMSLGLYALEFAVANLLHCFTWELPNQMKPSELNMDDVFGLTAPRASRLEAVPTPRLLCPIY